EGLSSIDFLAALPGGRKVGVDTSPAVPRPLAAPVSLARRSAPRVRPGAGSHRRPALSPHHMDDRFAIEGKDADGPWSGDPAAGRLYRSVLEACDGEMDLPARLAAALRVSLLTLGGDPDQAWLLTVAPHMQSEE